MYIYIFIYLLQIHIIHSHKQQYHQLLVTGFGYFLATIRPTSGSTAVPEIIQCIIPIKVN